MHTQLRIDHGHRVMPHPAVTGQVIHRVAGIAPDKMRSAARIRALLARDRCCRYPGCTHRKWLDAHHVMHWVDSGKTSLDNTLAIRPSRAVKPHLD